MSAAPAVPETPASCWREACERVVDPWWAPWCSEDCYRVHGKTSEVVTAERNHPLTTGAAIHHAFPWLDVRSSG